MDREIGQVGEWGYKCFGGGGSGRDDAIDASPSPGRPAGFGAPPLALLFDELAFGVAIVERDGRLVHATRTARMQLQSQRGLRIVDDALEAGFPEQAQALRKALHDAASGLRSYLAFGRGANKSDVAILPLESGGAAVPMVALVFEKNAGSAGLGLYFFAQTHRLTRAEQSILNELCDGCSVIEAATRLGSSVHTARTHVRNILQKTSQPSLRALIRRIGMLPPVGARFAIAQARGEALAAFRPPVSRTVGLPVPRIAGEASIVKRACAPVL